MNDSHAVVSFPAKSRYLVPALSSFYRHAEPVAYVLLRMAFGLILLTHGIPKLLGIPHGSMADPMAGTRDLIAGKLHLPFAATMAVLAMLLETAGSVAIAVGFFTRFFAAAFLVEMIVICFAHAPVFVWIDRGFEYPLMLAFIAALLAVRGGGGFSIDRLLPKQL